MSDLLLRLRTIPNNFYEARLTMIVAADRIEALEAALEESVKLQSHYGRLLNAYDGGRRLQFANADAWITRLAALDKDTGK